MGSVYKGPRAATRRNALKLQARLRRNVESRQTSTGVRRLPGRDGRNEIHPPCISCTSLRRRYVPAGCPLFSTVPNWPPPNRYSLFPAPRIARRPPAPLRNSTFQYLVRWPHAHPAGSCQIAGAWPLWHAARFARPSHAIPHAPLLPPGAVHPAAEPACSRLSLPPQWSRAHFRAAHRLVPARHCGLPQRHRWMSGSVSASKD